MSRKITTSRTVRVPHWCYIQWPDGMFYRYLEPNNWVQTTERVYIVQPLCCEKHRANPNLLIILNPYEYFYVVYLGHTEIVDSMFYQGTYEITITSERPTGVTIYDL